MAMPERTQASEHRRTPTTEAPTVKVGLVGLGYWGPNLLRVLADLPGVEVAWMCDLDEERLERFGRRFPAVRRTREVEDLLDDPTLDAVLIATPVFTHFTMAMRSLAAGKH